MVPTKERNHQSILISYNNEGLLIDCGEGTQRQLKLANIKPSKITKILISHWHGDHVLGLPGLFQTLNKCEFEKTLEIYGPKGTKKHFEYMFKAFEFENSIDYKIIEINREKIIETKDFCVYGYALEHGIDCYGFVFLEKDKRKIKLSYTNKLGIPEGPLLGKLQNNQSIKWNEKKIAPEDATYIVKGKKIGIINDTVLCNNCNKIAEDADILICEAVYISDLEKKAKEYMHLTAKQAALIASRNNVKKLVLTHFSQRYKTTEEFLDEAKTIFKDSLCAYDLMKVKL
ncbi:ribonuclease Z [Candidatus Woesearchaeota archaeon]|nr:ribonuclease Z [Candidatus Woesearchaeota archaeon]